MSIAKHRWMLSLVVGDSVEDCNYNIKQITQIYEERSIRRGLRWLPGKLIGWLEQRDLFCTTYNKTVTFNDGNQCSIMDCADPPDGDYSRYE